MADRLEAVVDHLAIGVPDREEAAARWEATLGGLRVRSWQGRSDGLQLRYANHARLEVLAPPPGIPEHFVRRFLDRFGGARVHHLTLHVADLDTALETVAGAGLDAVDIGRPHPARYEAFLRPSQVGGLVVQLVSSDETDPPGEPSTAVELAGARLRHPDLEAARQQWELLGAEVSPEGEALWCRWPESAIGLVIEAGEPAGPVSVLARHAPALPPDPRLGPALEAL